MYPVELKAVANFLRNKSGIKLRTGALGGKRVDYFKGPWHERPSSVADWQGTY